MGAGCVTVAGGVASGYAGVFTTVAIGIRRDPPHDAVDGNAAKATVVTSVTIVVNRNGTGQALDGLTKGFAGSFVGNRHGRGQCFAFVPIGDTVTTTYRHPDVRACLGDVDTLPLIVGPIAGIRWENTRLAFGAGNT